MAVFLVALDGSESSLRALAAARAECSRMSDSSLHLITVHSPWDSSGASPTDLERVARLSKTYDEWVIGQARPFLEPHGPRYAHESLQGDAALVIVETAQMKQCVAIFLGARGMSVSRDGQIGSTASRVRDLSAVPVRVID